MGAKKRVYLAGPISGCNEDQRRHWRERLRLGFEEEFEFIDPTDKPLGVDASDFEMVQADVEAIKACDAVLANMWKESIGTAFGILHAHLSSKVVVVVDPNLIKNRMVAFYADDVVHDLHAGLNSIRTFFAAEQRITKVVKEDGSEDQFDRRKLSEAIRGACRKAGESDLGPARAILRGALEDLLGDHLAGEREVTTKQVTIAVWRSMAELAADPAHEADYDAIRRAWDEHKANNAQQRRFKELASLPQVVVHAKPLEVQLSTAGTHSTIWGSGKVGPGAREIFDEMKRVSGLTQIRLGRFANTSSPPSKPHVRLSASTTSNLIEGKMYDRGPKGTLQTFQIHVADERQRDDILDTLRRHLEGKGHIRAAENAYLT